MSSIHEIINYYYHLLSPSLLQPLCSWFPSWFISTYHPDYLLPTIIAVVYLSSENDLRTIKIRIEIPVQNSCKTLFWAKPKHSLFNLTWCVSENCGKAFVWWWTWNEKSNELNPDEMNVSKWVWLSNSQYPAKTKQYSYATITKIWETIVFTTWVPIFCYAYHEIPWNFFPGLFFIIFSYFAHLWWFGVVGLGS